MWVHGGIVIDLGEGVSVLSMAQTGGSWRMWGYVWRTGAQSDVERRHQGVLSGRLNL